MEKQNIALARRVVEQGFGEGRLEIIDEIVADNFVEHQGGMNRTVEGPKSAIRDLHVAFPDISYRFINSVAEGDMITVHYRASGTHTGNLGPMGATGRTFEIDVIDIMRFSEGKLVEHWGVPDRLGMLESLGFWPPKS